MIFNKNKIKDMKLSTKIVIAGLAIAYAKSKVDNNRLRRDLAMRDGEIMNLKDQLRGSERLNRNLVYQLGKLSGNRK